METIPRERFGDRFAYTTISKKPEGKRLLPLAQQRSP
jgi:hypothetical protein